MDNRKNTILLTVIAIATLLVAVVGATFAFFTAQGGAAKDVDITVKTSSIDNATLGTWSAINITADQDTFAEGQPNRVGTSSGTVEFSASNGSTSTTEYCYTAVLSIGKNPFVYSKDNVTDEAKGTTRQAELTLTAVKTSKVGDQVAQEPVTLANAVDITTLGNKDLLGSDTAMEYRIPTTPDGTDYIHRISILAAISEDGKDTNAPRKQSDAWDLTVTLVNLNLNQNENAGKLYDASIRFAHVDCTTGEEIVDTTTTAE